MKNTDRNFYRGRLLFVRQVFKFFSYSEFNYIENVKSWWKKEAKLLKNVVPADARSAINILIVMEKIVYFDLFWETFTVFI